MWVCICRRLNPLLSDAFCPGSWVETGALQWQVHVDFDISPPPFPLVLPLFYVHSSWSDDDHHVLWWMIMRATWPTSTVTWSLLLRDPRIHSITIVESLSERHNAVQSLCHIMNQLSCWQQNIWLCIHALTDWPNWNFWFKKMYKNQNEVENT